jgi:hypothetical protein
MRTTPDPKLKALRVAIHELMKEHDVCGTIVLQSVDAVEYAMEVEASWSCATFVHVAPDGAAGVRVKTTDLPPEQKQKMLENTVGMVLGQVDVMTELLSYYQAVAAMLAEHIEVQQHTTRRV